MDQSSTATVPRVPAPPARVPAIEDARISKGKGFLLVENREFMQGWPGPHKLKGQPRTPLARRGRSASSCSLFTTRASPFRAPAPAVRRHTEAKAPRPSNSHSRAEALPPRTPTPPRPSDHAQEARLQGQEGESSCAGARAREGAERAAAPDDAALRPRARLPSVNTTPSWCGPRRLGGGRGPARRATARQ